MSKRQDQYFGCAGKGSLVPYDVDVIPYLLKTVVAEQDDTCRELIGSDCFVRGLKCCEGQASFLEIGSYRMEDIC